MSDKSQNQAPPSYDPGWNDPPKVAYSENSPAQHNKLNKRIAFPLQGAKPVGGSPILPSGAPPSMPPILPAASHPKTISLPTSASTNTDTSNAGNHLETVKEVFQKITDEMDKRDEICSRLTTMYSSWNDLNGSVQQILVDLAKALESKNHQQGTTLHRSLIVNHGSVCKLWAPALRQLIHHIIETNEADVHLNAEKKSINPIET